ncbi:MAG: hypothetical protein V1492_05540 [Candidatus Micrarchaeota archaeon]
MRYAIVILLVLLAGCLQPSEQTTPNVTVNQTANNATVTNITAGNTTNATLENITNNSIVGNITAPAVNQSNATANYTAPVENTTESRNSSGIFFGEGSYVLLLDDLVIYSEDRICAAVTLAYANGTELKKDVLCQGSNYWTAPDGHRFRIEVLKTAAGYTGQHWASVIIYG